MAYLDFARQSKQRECHVRYIGVAVAVAVLVVLLVCHPSPDQSVSFWVAPVALNYRAASGRSRATSVRQWTHRAE